ncbi:hypothetical protein [Vibrio vulnificus]
MLDGQCKQAAGWAMYWGHTVLTPFVVIEAICSELDAGWAT